MEAIDILEAQLPSWQKKAADQKDEAALHLVDAIMAIKEHNSERLALIFLLKFRIEGFGGAAATIAVNAMSKFAMLLSGGA